MHPSNPWAMSAWAQPNFAPQNFASLGYDDDFEDEDDLILGQIEDEVDAIEAEIESEGDYIGARRPDESPPPQSRPSARTSKAQARAD